MTPDEIQKRTELFLQVLKKFPEFRYLGDPILRQKTKNVSLKESIRIGHKLGKVLIKYRKIAGIGRGLAAPQIGEAKSVFVTYLNDEIQVYINPKMISKSKKLNRYREMCLSCGTMWADIKRPDKIKLQWKDEAGKIKEKEFSGFVARLIQHEYDHLQGIPNLDIAQTKTLEFVTSNPLSEKIRPA
jgi:peptide deformylase